MNPRQERIAIDPTTGEHIVRRVGPRASEVLEELAARRRHSLIVREDKEWLGQITPYYFQLLDEMEESKLLYRLASGRYLVAPRATFSPAQAASVQLMASLVLRPYGEYYLGYLTALIDHRLTDLHSSDIYAAIRQDATGVPTRAQLPTGGILHVTRLAESRWPSLEGELDRVRTLPDSREFIMRSGVERTLVDALSRPELSGGIETVISCWARARYQPITWDLACEIAKQQGKSMARRVSFVLRLIGLGAIADEQFSALPARGASTPLDRSKSYDLSSRDMHRDAKTGVLVNVPERSLLGWVGGSELP